MGKVKVGDVGKCCWFKTEENRDRFNGSPRLSFFTAKRREERKNFKIPLTLTLSRRVEREDEEKRI
jgi:hypothetical protein